MRWNKIVPMANCEALTLSSNGQSWSGWFRAMSCSMSLMRVEMVFLCASPQVYFVFFFSRSMSGQATSTKPGINGLWYPKTPSVLRTPVMVLCSVGHSSRPRCFTGSNVIFLSSTMIPR